MSFDPLVKERFQLVKGEYNKILKLVDNALTIEQNGDPNSALQQYSAILDRMETILGMNCSKVFTNEYLQEALNYQRSLYNLKENINESMRRLTSTKSTMSANNESVAPDLKEILFSIERDVQYYKVYSNGEISVPSYPSSLIIYNAPSTSNAQTDQPIRPILQVGDWETYLQSGVTPVLITKLGIIMFIDQTAATQTYVGILLPPMLPSDCRDTLYSVLSSLACLKIENTQINGGEEKSHTDIRTTEFQYEHSSSHPPSQQVPEFVAKSEVLIQEDCSRSDISQGQSDHIPKQNVVTVAKSITSFSERLSAEFIRGADSAGRSIYHYSDCLCKMIEPGDPSAPVDPKLQRAASYIRTGSSGVVYASGKLVEIVGKGAKKVGTAVAPTVRKGCDRVLPESWLKPDPNSNNLSKFDKASIVAGASLAGLGKLWTGLEDGSKILGRHLVRSTSTVVKHKYGDEAGSTTTNVMYSAGNIGMSGYNLGYIGPKGIAKSLATETGRAVIDKYSTENGPYPPAYTTSKNSNTNGQST